MKPKKIVLVDDEVHLTIALSIRLEQLGFETATAENGQAGLELIQSMNPNLVVTDYQMPVLDGYDMCVKLHEDPETRDTPIIMLTARGHRLSEEQLSATHIAQLVAKPFSTRELLQEIDRLVGLPGAENASPAA